jgi:hypothetical protein
MGDMGGSKIQLSAMEPKTLFPKIASERGVMAYHNKSWHTMKFENIIHEYLSDYGGFKGVL